MFVFALSELMGVQIIKVFNSCCWNIITFSQSLKYSFRNFVNYLSIFVNDLERKSLWKLVTIFKHYCACFLQCPGGAFTPNMRTTKEFPDDVVTFIRNHPLMFNPIYPIHKRPLIIRIGTDYKYTKIAVDRVNAADGRYHVLFLGTGKTKLTISSIAF